MLQEQVEGVKKEQAEKEEHQKAEGSASAKEANEQLQRDNKDLNLQIQYLRNAAQNQEAQWT